MTVYLKSGLIALLAVTSLCVLAAEDPADVQLRMANGTVIEGTMQAATPDGLVIQGERGKYTAPWKYLSAGTRYRYERPMLAAQEAARSNALQKAAAAATAASKVAAAKAKAAATGTNVVGGASNRPPAKK